MIEKYPGNPIVNPTDVPPSLPGLRVLGAFNPGAIRFGEEVLLLMRVAELCEEQKGKVRMPFYRFAESTQLAENTPPDQSSSRPGDPTGWQDRGGRQIHQSGRATTGSHREAEPRRQPGQSLQPGCGVRFCPDSSAAVRRQDLGGVAFTTLGGEPRYCLGRLNYESSLDTAFDPGSNGVVFAFVVQTDGKIVVAGTFTSLGGQSGGSLLKPPLFNP